MIKCLLAFMVLASAAYAGDLITFSTEREAKQRCPDDTVVWLERPKNIYHYPGRRWFGVPINGTSPDGETKNDVFVCETEAARMGNAPSRDGQ